LKKTFIKDGIAYPGIILLSVGNQRSAGPPNTVTTQENPPAVIHSCFIDGNLMPVLRNSGPARHCMSATVCKISQRYFRALADEAPPWLR
jgi:hypothetical protein